MSLMFAQMGLAVIGQFSSHSTNDLQARLDRSMQAYRNTLTALSAAGAQNAITLNSIDAADVAEEEALQIRVQGLQQQGTAEVAAAASGTSGNSVGAVVQSLKANALRANTARLKTLGRQLQSYDAQREQTELDKRLNTDISVIPSPSIGSSLLGLGTNLLKIVNSHQTPGNTIAARLSGTVGSTAIGGVRR